MRNKRSTTIVLSFFSITFLVVLFSVNIQIEIENDAPTLDVETIETTVFKGAKYYVLKDGAPSLSVKAIDINIYGKNAVDFFNPIGVLYHTPEEEVNFEAIKGHYNFKTEKLELVGKVSVKNIEGTYYSDNLLYEMPKKEIRASGNVKSILVDKETGDKMQLHSNKMHGWEREERILFVGNVRGKLERKRKYELGYSFEARKLDYLGKDSLMQLQGDVKILRKNYDLEAERAEIFLENYNKKLKYYVMYDDIKLEEKLKLRTGSQIRRAYAEKLEGYISDGKIILSGAPRVEQGRDIIKGYQITLRENTEIVEVDDSQSSFRFKKEKN